jgi:thioredoxin-dependent peroxiredoxin
MTAVPGQWRNEDDVFIAGSASDDDAVKMYPDGWDAPRPYMRIVPQPA